MSITITITGVFGEVGFISHDKQKAKNTFMFSPSVISLFTRACVNPAFLQSHKERAKKNAALRC